MNNLQKAAIFLVLVLSAGLVWAVTNKLQQWIGPRRSFGRLMFYLVISLATVFVCTFVIVVLISKLFPLPKR